MRQILPIILMSGSLVLTGCYASNSIEPAVATTTTTTTTTPAIPAVITGNVHGGLAPVSGAHVYLMAVGAGGYGTASTSVLNSAVTGHSDSTGAYILTDGVGGYSIPAAALACTSDQLTYLLATGGSAGFGANSAATLIAGVGACPVSGSTATMWINEVSTVGTSYALAAFATDALHISSSGSASAKLGIKNAFTVIPNLYNAALGQARATTPNGNGTVPQQTINTLANMLAACINTAGGTAPTCQSLFSAASGSASVADTAAAAMALAHTPGANLTSLFTLQSLGGAVFQPALAAAPTSLILPVLYTGGGISNPYSLAIDGAGIVWVGNGTDGVRTGFSTGGVPLSANGFPDGLTHFERSAAVDPSGNVWAADLLESELSETSPAGAIVAAPNVFAATGIHAPLGLAFDKKGMLWVGDDYGLYQLSPTGTVMTKIAIPSAYDEGPGDVEIDGLGNVWATNIDNSQLIKFSSTGVPLWGVAGIAGGGLNSPQGIAVDAKNNIWIANSSGTTISKFDNNGNPLSPNGFSGGGINTNRYLAIDGAGNVWSPSSVSGMISEFDNNGNPLSPTGYAANPAGKGFWEIAIDASGNVWSASTEGSLVQLVGAATPVITPLTTAAANNQLGTRP